MESGITNLLGDGSFLNSNNDAILPLNSHNGGSSSDSLHRIFDLQQVSIGTKNGNGTIVRHDYSDSMRLSVLFFLCLPCSFNYKTRLVSVLWLARLMQEKDDVFSLW